MPSGTVVVGDISGIFTCIFVIGDFLSGGDIFFFYVSDTATTIYSMSYKMLPFKYHIPFNLNKISNNLVVSKS